MPSADGTVTLMLPVLFSDRCRYDRAPTSPVLRQDDIPGIYVRVRPTETTVLSNRVRRILLRRQERREVDDRWSKWWSSCMYLCCSLNRSAAGKLSRRLSLCVLVCVSCSPCVHIYERAKVFTLLQQVGRCIGSPAAILAAPGSYSDSWMGCTWDCDRSFPMWCNAS
jgi:hypothetical protein